MSVREELTSGRRRKGSQRVKAWVYSIINPLLEALQGENTLLASKNITWRYHTQRMEFIVPTREHIQSSARPNYDDFLRGYAEVKPQMQQRDLKQQVLSRAAIGCWEYLTKYDLLKPTVELHLKQWKEEGNPYPGGAVPEKEFWLLMAEHVMNNAQELPHHYTNRAFWSRFRQQLLAWRMADEFSKLEESVADLVKSNELLVDGLDRARSSLCEEYNIPAAPF
jgi:hypothetical protein